jgi:hypothetical protein
MNQSLTLSVKIYFALIWNYAEEELNEASNIIYQPPPLHEVWLDEAGRQQGNEDQIRQCWMNKDLMRDCNCAVRQAIPVNSKVC